MVGSLLSRLGLFQKEPAPAERGIVESIEQRLSSMGPRRAAFVAAFAGLLARVAYADDEVSDGEADRILGLVREHTNLSEPEAEAVMLIARNRVIVLGGAENHLLTRRFNELASEAEKGSLIDCLYAVAVADDLVRYVEDREVRRIADALLIPPSKFFEIRARYRNRLEELISLRRLRKDPG